MVQIVGTYKYVSNAPNFESYLKALGVPDSQLATVANRKPNLTISENNGQWTFHNSEDGNEWSSTFKLGEPFDETVATGSVVKSVAKRVGDTLIIESAIHGADDSRVYEFNDSGISVKVTNAKFNGTTGAVYERV